MSACSSQEWHLFKNTKTKFASRVFEIQEKQFCKGSTNKLF